MASPLLEQLQLFRQQIELGVVKIRSRSGKLMVLKENEIQTRILDAMDDQARADQPIRIIIPKSRKLGASTIVAAFLRFLAKNVAHWHSYIAAHTAESTLDIFDIARRIEKHDPAGADVGARALKYGHDSQFTCATAGGHYIGSASTKNALLLSELPKWQGSANTIKDQMLSLLNAVPDDPNSIVVIEATANQADPSGDFEARCWAAQRGDGDYKLVFGPWFSEPTYQTKGLEISDVDEDEKYLREQFWLTDAQLCWRRRTIINNCAGSVVRFKQEFPATLDEAFTVATGRIFPMLRREVHGWHLGELNVYDCYRGVDWGGAHDFVCVWTAHLPSERPAFTVDIEQCPLTWQALTGWSRDENGKPLERFKDAVDAVRYTVMQFNLTGRVHVYRELVVRNSAALGLSELDLAERIKLLSVEPIISTVADRSRPNSINLFNQRQVWTVAMQQPKTTVVGEIEDGIAQLHGLMVATTPFFSEREPESLVRRLLRLQSDGNFDFSVGDPQLALEMNRVRELDNERYGHPVLGNCY